MTVLVFLFKRRRLRQNSPLTIPTYIIDINMIPTKRQIWWPCCAQRGALPALRIAGAEPAERRIFFLKPEKAADCWDFPIGQE